MSRSPPFFSDKLFSVFLIAAILVLIVQSVEGSSPVWLKEGVYAEYEFNGSSFRWECVRLDGNKAELNVTYTSASGNRRWALFHVDAGTRDAAFPNGTRVGKTLFWLPANPKQDETIVVSDTVTAKVQIGGAWETLQGAQKVFYVEKLTSPKFLSAYDLDTGVLINLYSMGGDDILRAVGVTWGISTDKLSGTNIDLGPREWWPTIGRALPILLPFTAFILIFIFLLYRRMKRRRRIMQRVKGSKKTGFTLTVESWDIC